MGVAASGGDGATAGLERGGAAEPEGGATAASARGNSAAGVEGASPAAAAEATGGPTPAAAEEPAECRWDRCCKGRPHLAPAALPLGVCTQAVLFAPTLPPLCRICLMPDAPGNLVSPCHCTGTVRYAHLSCLVRWSRERASTRCEICGSTYRPEVLPQVEAAVKAQQASGGRGGAGRVWGVCAGPGSRVIARCREWEIRGCACAAHRAAELPHLPWGHGWGGRVQGGRPPSLLERHPWSARPPRLLLQRLAEVLRLSQGHEAAAAVAAGVGGEGGGSPERGGRATRWLLLKVALVLAVAGALLYLVFFLGSQVRYWYCRGTAEQPVYSVCPCYCSTHCASDSGTWGAKCLGLSPLPLLPVPMSPSSPREWAEHVGGSTWGAKCWGLTPLSHLLSCLPSSLCRTGRTCGRRCCCGC